MKILVTGANGYLGQGVVRKLLDNGNEVIATDRVCNCVDDRAKIRECDLFSVQNPFDFFNRPEVVLHLAWRDGFVHYSDVHIDDLPKHYTFLKKIAGSEVKRIAVMGSMHEVGFFEGSVKDSTPCFPVTPYGVSKNALRELTSMLCAMNDKQFVWLRGYYIVGSGMNGSSVFSKLTLAEKNGEKEFPFTMGQNQFDFIDYNVFCEQVAKAICQDRIMGIINICSGHPEKLADRVERFIKENGFRIKLKYGAFPDRPYDSKAIWGDDEKIRKIIALDEGKKI